jgi:hypothetical protein
VREKEREIGKEKSVPEREREREREREGGRVCLSERKRVGERVRTQNCSEKI